MRFNLPFFKDYTYVAINHRKYNEKKLLTHRKLYKILKKYEDYDQTIDLENESEITKKVSNFIHELFSIGIMCANYNDFIKNIPRPITDQGMQNLNIMQYLSIITSIQRSDYWSGGNYNEYADVTKNHYLPKIIKYTIKAMEPYN